MTTRQRFETPADAAFWRDVVVAAVGGSRPVEWACGAADILLEQYRMRGGPTVRPVDVVDVAPADSPRLPRKRGRS